MGRKHWNLGVKLALVGTPFLLLALLSIAATLWVSWQLDGGAAAVNEAGRMRMQAYRMSLAVGTGEIAAVPQLAAEFERSLDVLRHGDPERPLFVPWDDSVRQRFAQVEHDWLQFRGRWIAAPPAAVAGLRDDVASFTSHIDVLVAGIESHMSRWTALLHLLQMAMMALAVLGAAVLLYTGYLFVLEPVNLLKQAIERIEGGDFGARVERVTSDEFGTLAEGFNGMAAHLQSMYRHLESKVSEKTAQLEEKRERLENLYEVTALVAKATDIDELAQGFVRSVARISRADGVALRWSDQANQRYLMLAAEGLPVAMVEGEQCVNAGDCHCGAPSDTPQLRVIPIRSVADANLQHCALAGFETVVSVPIRLHERLMGEVDLFFHAQISLSAAERSLLEALASHLASAFENLRLNALEREAAVAQERNLLARELHDSIAQSLAFLKIQVQLMRDAQRSGDARQVDKVLDEIDIGVRECYGDVRELLLHFRTRTNAEDIEPALITTLRKFEHQSGLTATLQVQGHGMPLSPDLQIQVLHIVQEALSNVRKHARASQVWVDVQQQPQWRFEVRDDGRGFEHDPSTLDETHVGLRIMQERAERLGATLEVLSTPQRGTSVILTLPPPVLAQAGAEPLAQAA
ncbi:type IV pili methyl-accepting chemotaxis transducer N-terminal domain-containing protein [Piscinibacter sp.]|jgi:two-component system nitrate/nitrite sensor histidine kinase NarX|uniref:type IV pili methyl-accepting chemotaxis transducer N-terminal domain-containing protein n=1 Tax=Piscinibacter sp. TaxID=1903157 RepID=UPI003559FD12